MWSRPPLLAPLLALLLACVLCARGDTCASCAPPTAEDGELLEAVKRHILSRLQLRDRPNITHPLPRAAMVTALRKLHAGKLRDDGRVEIPHLDGHPLDEVLEDSSEIISFAEKGEPPEPGPGLGSVPFRSAEVQRWSWIMVTLQIYGGSSLGRVWKVV